VAAPFGADQKERAAPGRRMAEGILRMLKVIADIAQRGGNVTGACDRDLKRAAPGLPFSEKKSIGISLAIHSCNLSRLE